MYARKQPLLICVPYSVGEKVGEREAKRKGQGRRKRRWLGLRMMEAGRGQKK
jgi:hypothetical protein